jgi:hypothetical protein
MTARRILIGGIIALMAFGYSFAAGAAKKLPSLAGTYANSYGTVTIKQTADGFDVDISTAEPTSGKWVCDFSESGKLDARGVLVVDYHPEPGADTAAVKLMLALKGDVLTVTETRSAEIVDFCGYRGFVHGNYRRHSKRQ